MQTNWESRRTIIRGLLGLTLISIFVMGYKVAEPYWAGAAAAAKYEADTKLQLPDYDLKAWAEWPVLEDGRIKPLQTVAIESVRQITGRATFQGHKAVPLFLSWIFYDPKNVSASSGVDWDRYPFILCEDHELRAVIYGVKMDDAAAAEKIHAKFISPLDLHQSEAFQRLLVSVNKEREKDNERYQQKLTALQRKASTVMGRLNEYEQLAGPLESRHSVNTGVAMNKEYLTKDAVHYVALDKAKDSSWFSIGELRFISSVTIAPALSPEENAKFIWERFMQQRVALQPRLYLADEAQKALTQLKEAIRNGQTETVITELKAALQSRQEKQQDASLEKAVKQEMARLKVDTMTDEQIKEVSAQTGQPMSREDIRKTIASKMKESVREQQAQRDKKIVSDLSSRLSSITKPYVAEDPKYSQMYMDYLEARYPELYQAAIGSQPVPLESIKTVLAAYDAVGQAYRSGNAQQFATSSDAFRSTITTVSKQYAGPEYPGETTVNLELLLNRVEPFKWAWISMLLAAICFALSMKMESRILYQVAFVPFIISLGFQVFAYYGRVSISGRPPVSNMFETVVFVASMGAVFALVLEYFYRSTIIILSGSCVATLGLILADQLPYSSGFDAKIQPLVPVLRSNYWLIIHVMTIVASYAAGALAWAIGNISLILYWFNSDRRDLLKNMANLCYSAIKVAVLLLGIGTLLGGIWAAESWGRFWGWDPKETWALIALIVYLLPLHARYIGWVKDFGMAIASVVCFSAIVMSWYGVNFILGAGLHSYGMGDGGPWLMFLLGGLNLLWVLVVCHRRASMELQGVPQLA